MTNLILNRWLKFVKFRTGFRKTGFCILKSILQHKSMTCFCVSCRETCTWTWSDFLMVTTEPVLSWASRTLFHIYYWEYLNRLYDDKPHQGLILLSALKLTITFWYFYYSLYCDLPTYGVHCCFFVYFIIYLLKVLFKMFLQIIFYHCAFVNWFNLNTTG